MATVDTPLLVILAGLSGSAGALEGLAAVLEVLLFNVFAAVVADGLLDPVRDDASAPAPALSQGLGGLALLVVAMLAWAVAFNCFKLVSQLMMAAAIESVDEAATRQQKPFRTTGNPNPVDKLSKRKDGGVRQVCYACLDTVHRAKQAHCKLMKAMTFYNVLWLALLLIDSCWRSFTAA